MNNFINVLKQLNLVKVKKNKNGGKTYKLLKNFYDLSETVNPTYPSQNIIMFQLLSDLNKYDVFDGNNYTIQYMYNGSSLSTNALSNYDVIGLFKSLGTSLDNAPIIKNLNVKLGYVYFETISPATVILYRGYGGIMTRDQQFFKIYNCNVSVFGNGTRSGLGNGSGGICGELCSNFELNNCTFTLNATTGSSINRSGIRSGGICGQLCNAENYSVSNIENCSFSLGNTTDSSGYAKGGIVGPYVCSGSHSEIYIKNCYSATLYDNNVLYNTSGGIVGPFSCNGYKSKMFVYGCFSTIPTAFITSGGTWNYTLCVGSGGICGAFTGIGDKCLVKIKRCYSTGNIGQSCGGIVGYSLGGSFYNDTVLTPVYSVLNKPTIKIIKCYSTGVSSVSSGGICGESCGVGKSRITIYKCYSTGNIGQHFITKARLTGWYNSLGRNNDSYAFVYGSFSTAFYSGSGGICGTYCGYNNTTSGNDYNISRVRIIKCTSKGDVYFGAGICGDYCGGTDTGNTNGIGGMDASARALPVPVDVTDSKVTIKYCKQKGNIIFSTLCSAILGEYSGYIPNNNSIANSYSYVVGNTCVKIKQCKYKKVLSDGTTPSTIYSTNSNTFYIKFIN
jgi:hypothetical protein